MGRHRLTQRNWIPLVAGSVVLIVTGAIVGFTAATGAPSNPAVALAVVPPGAAAPTPAGPPAASRRAAYLTALNKAGVANVEEDTIMLIASGACAQRQVGEEELVRQVVTLFPGRWTTTEAWTLVDSARTLLCDEGASGTTP